MSRLALVRAPPGTAVVLATGALLVVGNAAYCTLHGLVVDGTVAGEIAWVWAAKAVAGWWVAAMLVVWLAARGPLAVPERPTTRAWSLGIGLALPPFLVSVEWLLGRAAVALGGLPDAAGLGWLAYHRGPLVAAAGVVVAWLAATGRLARWCAPPASPTAITETLEVLSGSGRATVRLRDVERFESFQNYARVGLVDGRRYLLRTTMERLERELPVGRFVRVHRQTIVNVDHVLERRAEAVLVLRSGATVRVSRRHRDRLRGSAAATRAASAPAPPPSTPSRSPQPGREPHRDG